MVKVVQLNSGALVHVEYPRPDCADGASYRRLYTDARAGT